MMQKQLKYELSKKLKKRWKQENLHDEDTLNTFKCGASESSG